MVLLLSHRRPQFVHRPHLFWPPPPAKAISFSWTTFVPPPCYNSPNECHIHETPQAEHPTPPPLRFTFYGSPITFHAPLSTNTIVTPFYVHLRASTPIFFSPLPQS
jgi:hypothetical protein